jgi:hypothetical protein
VAVRLAAGARVRAIGPDKLLPLLSDMEASGRRRAMDTGDPRDPVIAQLRTLRIESVSAVPAKAGSEGKVQVRPGTYGGWGWGGPAIDEWLERFFALDQGVNKLSKLGRAAATERHLVIVLDSFSQAGLGVPVGLQSRREPGAADYVLPSFMPPEPLTHCWLLPAFGETWDGLRWARDGGWVVLDALGPPPTS